MTRIRADRQLELELLAFARDVCAMGHDRGMDAAGLFAGFGMALTAVIKGLDDVDDRHRAAQSFATSLTNLFPARDHEQRLH